MNPIFDYDHKKSDERIERVMVNVGMKDSTNLYLRLKQFETEIVVSLREKAKEMDNLAPEMFRALQRVLEELPPDQFEYLSDETQNKILGIVTKIEEME